jgi:hypothetical protein
MTTTNYGLFAIRNQSLDDLPSTIMVIRPGVRQWSRAIAGNRSEIVVSSPDRYAVRQLMRGCHQGGACRPPKMPHCEMRAPACIRPNAETCIVPGGRIFRLPLVGETLGPIVYKTAPRLSPPAVGR